MDLLYLIRRSIASILKKLVVIFEPKSKPIQHSLLETKSQATEKLIHDHIYFLNQGDIPPKTIQSDTFQTELLQRFDLSDYVSNKISTNVVNLISDHINYLYYLKQDSYQSQITCILVILCDSGYLTTTFVKVVTDLYAHLSIPLKANNTKPARYSRVSYKGTHSMAYLSALSFLSPLISLDYKERSQNKTTEHIAIKSNAVNH